MTIGNERWELEKAIVEYANADKSKRSFELVQKAITRYTTAVGKEAYDAAEENMAIERGG